MMQLRVFLLVIAATATITALGIGGQPVSAAETTTDDIRRDVDALGRSIRDYSVERRDELVERSRATLGAVDQRIAELQRELDAKTSALSEQARERKQATLRALRKTRTEVAEWYGALKHGSRDAWAEIREGFSGAWQALSGALSRQRGN